MTLKPPLSLNFHVKYLSLFFFYSVSFFIICFKIVILDLKAMTCDDKVYPCYFIYVLDHPISLVIGQSILEGYISSLKFVSVTFYITQYCNNCSPPSMLSLTF